MVRFPTGLAALAVGLWVSSPVLGQAQPYEDQQVSADADPCFGAPPSPPVARPVRVGTGVTVYSGPGPRPSRATARPAPTGARPVKGTRGSEDGLLNVGDGDIVAALAIVVAAVAVLPIVISAVDEEAPPSVRRRHRCPSAEVRLVGGYTSAPTTPLDSGVGFGGVHATLGYGWVGIAGEFELGPPDVYQQQAGFLLLRPPPKAHVEFAVAAGYRRTVFGPLDSGAFELAMPQTYFFDPEQRNLGVRLRPALQYGNLGFDPRLDLSFLIPLGRIASLDLGGRVFTLEQRVQYAGFGNIAFNF